MANRPANSGKSNKPNRSKKSKKNQSLVVYQDQALGLSRADLPHSIIEVVGTLSRAGFEAYIVGGGVRDGLLGLAPKDFDAVTSARPHEIKAIFGGRCRIIGKRFQLAHVYSGRELIEVATFRAPPKDDTHTTDEGMITRDNVWGDINQDFARRDFSINALYYQPIAGEVLDFCGAIDDIQNRTLRLLGDAKVRVEEDPVRLLRALRFKAKLGFEFDDALAKQFHADNWALLEQVSAHRLYDETQKMFSGGYLTPLLPILFKYGAMDHLMAYAPNEPSALMNAIAKNTDHRVSLDKGVNPAFFYAALLWENYLHQLAKFKKKGLPFHEAQIKAAAKAIDMQRVKTAIPKFAEEFITSIWLMQPKLSSPRVRDIANLERHARFRAAFDFLIMREQHDDSALSEPTHGMGAWWQAYQDADAGTRAQMVERFANGGSATGLASRRRRSRASDELMQLKQLSSRDDEPVRSSPKPLFVVEGADEFLATSDHAPKESSKPVPRTRAVSVPTFAQVDYTDEDFLKLLGNDEPYIPASRYRKRRPSSTLSIKEREQGLTENDGVTDAPTKPKPTKPRKTKAVKDTATPSQEKSSAPAKPRRRKKSNAKPRAGD
ncbi:polynucleotide adenylyltransferase PcnB [Moraxella nasibovis]|uniref:polynucleotide adenylyltransferase PcnB n=1 Tax=Moraxella nasibovis TaxID=2904120 RepID=UPI002410A266|nr:polynucleotide adenylyltransferase PcnB [Moraxella nasibovis]WFF38582.1 polynucleotide adenylyltransferase PcnB [Moraxella nasibovis]